MFLIDDLLLSPVTLTAWLAQKIKDHAEQCLYDVEALKESLEELRERREAGEISDAEFVRREEKLLKALQTALEYHKAKS